MPGFLLLSANGDDAASAKEKVGAVSCRKPRRNGCRKPSKR